MCAELPPLESLPVSFKQNKHINIERTDSEGSTHPPLDLMDLTGLRKPRPKTMPLFFLPFRK